MTRPPRVRPFTSRNDARHQGSSGNGRSSPESENVTPRSLQTPGSRGRTAAPRTGWARQSAKCVVKAPTGWSVTTSEPPRHLVPGPITVFAGHTRRRDQMHTERSAIAVCLPHSRLRRLRRLRPAGPKTAPQRLRGGTRQGRGRARLAVQARLSPRPRPCGRGRTPIAGLTPLSLDRPSLTIGERPGVVGDRHEGAPIVWTPSESELASDRSAGLLGGCSPADGSLVSFEAPPM